MGFSHALSGIRVARTADRHRGPVIGSHEGQAVHALDRREVVDPVLAKLRAIPAVELTEGDWAIRRQQEQRSGYMVDDLTARAELGHEKRRVSVNFGYAQTEVSVSHKYRLGAGHLQMWERVDVPRSFVGLSYHKRSLEASVDVLQDLVPIHFKSCDAEIAKHAGLFQAAVLKLNDEHPNLPKIFVNIPRNGIFSNERDRARYFEIHQEDGKWIVTQIKDKPDRVHMRLSLPTTSFPSVDLTSADESNELPAVAISVMYRNSYFYSDPRLDSSQRGASSPLVTVSSQTELRQTQKFRDDPTTVDNSVDFSASLEALQASAIFLVLADVRP